MKPANLCRSCSQDFSSVASFDAHRVGNHAYLYAEGLRLDPPKEDGRRCLHQSEFEDAGLVLDRRGRWCLIARVEHARRRFRPDAGMPEDADGNARDELRAAGATPGKGRG